MPTQNELWTRFCKHHFFDAKLGIGLDISRVRFSDSFLAQMLRPMGDALSAMEDLERGEIANPDEKRMVGHYWLRQPSLAPNAEIRSAIESTLVDIHHFAKAVHTGSIAGAGGNFDRFLLIGIGGSALGPQLVANALGGVQDRLRPYYFDNTDPDGFDRTLDQLRDHLGRTLVLVTSKSGGTPETRNGMLEVQAAFAKRGIAFAPQAVAITQAGSQMDKVASQQGWLRRFPMWDWVGGRTSVTSAVGLLPMALQGIDINGFLAGAAEMDAKTRLARGKSAADFSPADLSQNPAALLALMWYAVGQGRGQKAMVVLPYKDRLELMARYLQQLVMESLGKELDRNGRIVYQGISVYGNKGSTDQHAYVQQLREGLPDFFATFIETLRDRDPGRADAPIEVSPEATSGDYLGGFLLGTRRALFENGRDSITITLDAISPASLGRLIALYERAVGLYAELVNINAYHQPGVEAGKKAAQKVLDVQIKAVRQLKAEPGKPQTADAIANAIGEPDEVETIFKILIRLASNPGRGIRALGTGNPDQIQFQPA